MKIFFPSHFLNAVKKCDGLFLMFIFVPQTKQF